jgi:ribosomal protein S12 methylthiotransferase
MAQKNETINLITLGCSKNVVDSEVLLKQLSSNHFDISDGSSGESDIAIINTCGFIEAAKRESIETILQAVDLKKRGKIKKVVVMGCLSERYAVELRRDIPDVDVFIGANKMDQVVTALGGDLKYDLLGERELTTPRHFAYLKISEGCDRPCSFCSIPLMRGTHVSKPLEKIRKEAERLAALGIKEIILIAQDSTYYGLDLYGERRLAGLLAELGTIDGIEWIRLMYAFPTGFPLDVLGEFQRNPKLCRYLDIPVQHASDTVLASMKRGITGQKLRALIRQIRDDVPGITLRTTLIVGYPGEWENEFKELVDFVGEMEFDRLGVFTYSQEEGTTAYPLGDPVPQALKDERRDTIMELQSGISAGKNARLVGSTQRVLVDEKDGGLAFGRTERDAPEVDNEVTVENAPDARLGEFIDCVIHDSDSYDLFAAPVDASRGSLLR